jgi:HEAT repeat protein
MRTSLANLAFIIVIAWFAGCSKRDSDPMTSSDPKEPKILIGHVKDDPKNLPEGMILHQSRSPDASERVSREPQVIGDPEQIRWTHARFDVEIDQLYSQAMARVQAGDGLYSEHQLAFRMRKSKAQAELQAIVDNPAQRPVARTQAALELIELGSGTGEVFLFESLGSPSSELRLAALKTLKQWNFHVDFSTAQRIERLLSMMDDNDESVASAAAELCGTRGIPGTEDKLIALLESHKPTNPERFAVSLAQVATTRRSVDAIVPYVLNERPKEYRYADGSAFIDLMKRTDPQVSEPIRKALHRFTLQFEAQRYDQTLVRDLAKTAAADSIPILEDIRRNAKDPVSRSYAGEALARLKPKQAVDLMLQLIEEQGPSTHLVAELRKFVTESDFDRVLSVIRPKLDKSKRAIDTELAGLFLEQFGSRGRAFVKERFEQLDADAKMWAKWKLQGISLRMALDELHRVGVIHTAPEDLINRMKAEAARSGSAEDFDLTDSNDVFNALGYEGILTVFDVETSTIPCDHHHLILGFAESSAGRFNPQWPVQIWHQQHQDDYDALYTVQFVYRNRLFRIGAENYGDWYDVKSVLNLMNFALITTGQPERFITLDSNGQVAAFVFADPKVFIPIAERYGLPLSDDPSKAMNLGIEYERQLLGK